MRRRAVILGLGAAALASPLAVRAQAPGRIYRLGRLAPGPNPMFSNFFLDELRKAGFAAGKNLAVIERYAAGDQAVETAKAMVAQGLDALHAAGPELAHAAQQATRTVPILTVSDDLLRNGIVTSLAHPGGNTTGISILATELDGKRQEILIELIPAARHLAALADPSTTAPAQLQALQDAAKAHGIALSVFRVDKAEEILPALDAAHAAGADALNVLAAAIFYVAQKPLCERATALGLPAIYQWPEMAEAGGFAAYGPRFSDVYRQAARQLVRIFNGAKPGDLPVEEPDTLQLTINLKTAKELGITVPPPLLARADEVIE
jgi:putative tryptophan/tyrosine transport system substrate-binding protein